MEIKKVDELHLDNNNTNNTTNNKELYNNFILKKISQFI